MFRVKSRRDIPAFGSNYNAFHPCLIEKMYNICPILTHGFKRESN